jgi:hypothetical protein
MKFAQRLAAATAALAWLWFLPAPAFGDSEEIEPNDSCWTAQPIGFLSALPHSVRGALDPEGDIDFFAFQAMPGSWLDARLLGYWSGEGTLFDPLLGLFDSACGLIGLDDDGGESLESRLRFVVPEDGQFVLAATSCCDVDFTGEHFYEGSYALVISAPREAIGSISGRVVDAVTGQPLTGSDWPYAWVDLVRCDGDNCWEGIGSAWPDFDGRFEFTVDWLGQPIESGSFQVHVVAPPYDISISAVFHVGAGQHFDLGTIALAPPPLSFGAISPCEDLPSGGGTCRYSVAIHNHTTETLRGLAWSNVSAYNTGSRLGWSNFTAARQQVANIRPGESRVARFSFDVPAGVADGAYMCTNAWFSLRENALLGTVGGEFLFCVYKREDGFRAVDPSALPRGLLQQMRQGPRPAHLPAKPVR